MVQIYFNKDVHRKMLTDFKACFIQLQSFLPFLSLTSFHPALAGVCLHAYLSVRGAGEAAVVSWITGSVLQTEARLVTLSDLTLSLRVQQFVQAELIHAVEMTEQRHRR